MNHIVRVKILTVGNSQVGKSCLIKRYCERRFVPKYLPTIGIDYGVTRLTVDNVDARVHIFDASGRQLFLDVRCEFYAGMTGLLLVYDVTERGSFEALDGWLAEARQFRGGSSAPVMVVCGNRTDLSPREVSTEEGESWAAEHGLPHFQTSACSGHGVQELFGDFFPMVVRAVATDKHYQRPITPTSFGSNPDLAAWIRRIRSAPNDWEKLGLKPGYNKDDVNRAYKSLAVLFHPDKNKGPEAVEAFKTISTVRNNLMKSLPN